MAAEIWEASYDAATIDANRDIPHASNISRWKLFVALPHFSLLSFPFCSLSPNPYEFSKLSQLSYNALNLLLFPLISYYWVLEIELTEICKNIIAASFQGSKSGRKLLRYICYWNTTYLLCVCVFRPHMCTKLLFGVQFFVESFSFSSKLQLWI
jgi:hypothetical protein